MVRTDRTFERDENSLEFITSIATSFGANWPDFWTGWKQTEIILAIIDAMVRTDRTFERDENF